MGKGRYLKTTNNKVPFWPFLIIIVILAVAALMFFCRNSSEASVEMNPSNTVSAENEAIEKEQAATPTETNQVEISGEIENTEDNQEQSNIATDSKESEETTKVEDTQKPTELQQSTETQPTQVIETQAPIEIVERADAEYEKWLSAAQVVCVSMEYPDFQLDGVYAASATSLENKYDSDGAYIIFTSGDTKMAFHSKALEQERSAAGTVDISTETIGYATFDSVDPATISVSSLEQIELEDLSELITQSLLVSIYAR